MNTSLQTSLAIEFLQKLIAIPSVSKEEHATADLIESYLQIRNIPSNRIANSVWAQNKCFNDSLPTLLLNSHHDTVPANAGYSRDPFDSEISLGKLYGLGSNDAGAALASLFSTFIRFYEAQLPFNIIFAASAEEEISGTKGMELLLQHLPKIDMAIVGEPTSMNMAIAEKGLLVLDCKAAGKSGHAARDEGKNAIYIAMQDIQHVQRLNFQKTSSLLGPVHLAVTSIETKNKLHNVIPDECRFLIDVRVNELYAFEEIIAELKSNMQSEIQPRSLRLKPSFIPLNHPLVVAGLQTELRPFGSPTLSDMALMNFPAIKLGPGDSARSHTADEFVYISEIENAVLKYQELLINLSQTIKIYGHEAVAKK